MFISLIYWIAIVHIIVISCIYHIRSDICHACEIPEDKVCWVVSIIIYMARCASERVDVVLFIL